MAKRLTFIASMAERVDWRKSVSPE